MAKTEKYVTYTNTDLMGLIMNYTDLKGAKRIVLDNLAFRCSVKTNYSCWPSINLIVHDTHYTRQQVCRTLLELEKDGYIKIYEENVRVNDMPRKQTMYYLNVPKLLAYRDACSETDSDSNKNRDPFNVRSMGKESDNHTTYRKSPKNETSRTSYVSSSYLPIVCETKEECMDMLRKVWSKDHLFASEPGTPEYDKFVYQLDLVAKTMGSYTRLGQALACEYEVDLDLYETVMNHQDPGLYLLWQAPKWLEKYKGRLVPVSNGKADEEEYD